MHEQFRYFRRKFGPSVALRWALYVAFIVVVSIVFDTYLFAIVAGITTALGTVQVWRESSKLYRSRTPVPRRWWNRTTPWWEYVLMIGVVLSAVWLVGLGS